MKIIFDIETGPAPLEQLTAIMPEFEASGTLKDPVKIEADIAKKRAAWLDKAALLKSVACFSGTPRRSGRSTIPTTCARVEPARADQRVPLGGKFQDAPL